jgi:hypothetical protein
MKNVVKNGRDPMNEVERLQANMLERLKRSSVDPGHYVGLADCRLDYCGRLRCAEACWFGNRHRRLREIRAVERLLQPFDGPLYEVRIVRGVWARPFGALATANIEAARQMNRRALDRLNNPKLVVVGTFKVAVAPEHLGEQWICEIHEIIAGAEYSETDKGKLEGVFRNKRPSGSFGNVRVKEVDALGPVLRDVLRRNLQCWHHPYIESESWPIKTTQFTEFYAWLLGLDPGARMIRYGCDRNFNKLSKKQRAFCPKVKKGHPYPYWLQSWMFGNHRLKCECRACVPHLSWRDER